MPRTKQPFGQKSPAVRELLEQNLETPVKEVVATLASRGMRVTPNLVYLVKSKMKGKRRRLKRQAAVAAGQNAGVANPAVLVRRVKELAVEAGGLSKLLQLVQILAE